MPLLLLEVPVQASKQNHLKPHRDGMKLPGAAHAALTGLKRVAGRGVAINMSPRWGLVQAGQCTSRPNERIEPMRMSAERSGQDESAGFQKPGAGAAGLRLSVIPESTAWRA